MTFFPLVAIIFGSSSVAVFHFHRTWSSTRWLSPSGGNCLFDICNGPYFPPVGSTKRNTVNFKTNRGISGKAPKKLPLLVLDRVDLEEVLCLTSDSSRRCISNSKRPTTLGAPKRINNIPNWRSLHWRSVIGHAMTWMKHVETCWNRPVTTKSN